MKNLIKQDKTHRLSILLGSFNSNYLVRLSISMCVLVLPIIGSAQWNPNFHITSAYNLYNFYYDTYSFNYNQVPANIVQITSPVNGPTNGLTYEWQSSLSPAGGFAMANMGTAIDQQDLAFNTPLQQTTYFRCKVSLNGGYNTIYSNIIKYSVVSINWEDQNYVREHDVLVPGIIDWKTVDQLPIGQKTQSTNYVDGLGRPIQKIDREAATPSSGSLWGDIVQYSVYDQYGRQPNSFLPYATSTESGRLKSNPNAEQLQFYAANYNETFPYSQTSYDGSPFNRASNIKSPGGSWAAGLGNSSDYDMNTQADNVQMFTVLFNSGDIPVSQGVYPDNTLIKTISTDENGKKVVQYTNKSGQVVLKKVQLDDNPGTGLYGQSAYNGWLCTYSVYDDFGRLRYQIPPEAVKWIDDNAWSTSPLSTAAGQQVLDGLCFRFEYDEKGRAVLKKAPGAKPLNKLYDSRDRVVFMQDGNQAAQVPTPQWTANLYDELDRVVITTLYNTGKNIQGLKSDIASAITTTVTTGSAASQPLANPTYNSRNASITDYTATQSITFLPGFVSPDPLQPNDQGFKAYITNGSVNGTGPITTTIYNNPISPTDLTNSAVTTILKYNFYDDYLYTGAKPFDNGFGNSTAYPTGSNVLPIAVTGRTIGIATGTSVRVLGTSTFLTTTSYYGEKGQHVQTISDNIKQGLDVATTQYGWDGRLLSTDTKHTVAGTAYINYEVLSKTTYDKIGRPILLEKYFGGSATPKQIASYAYDEFGRPKSKVLDPGFYNTTTQKYGLENLAYSYNIRGQLMGINKDYALKAGGYNKWDNYFGLYLGYDDNTHFANKQLNGLLTGQLWVTQGDDEQRRYDYTYDNSGRLLNADFKQNFNGTWGKAPASGVGSAMDFSTNNIAYDMNGNLKSMVHMGIKVGTPGTVRVDDLGYSYQQYSNKLLSVTDNGNLGTANGGFGDFKDGGNGTTDDYIYDDNGNLVVDRNKNVQDLAGSLTHGSNAGHTDGITYNFLDKPEQVRITGKGTIKIVYDADGHRLQRTYTPDAGGSKTTTYINGYVYEQKISATGADNGLQLQFIGFEEGRIRAVQPVSTGNNSPNGATLLDAVVMQGTMDLPGVTNGGAFDFFIRDQQQNTRMILTEESHSDLATCTMETARQSFEDGIFQGSGKELDNTRTPGPVPGWASNQTLASKVGNLANSKIGPNRLLKVMAGDAITATADYFYNNNNTNNSPHQPIQSMLTSLAGALASSTGLPMGVESNATDIKTQLGLDGNFSDYVDKTADNDGSSVPKAYLNVLFFDERFNFVQDGSYSTRVTAPGDGQGLQALSKLAPKNGYAYIYLSNESDENVYFDNLAVSDKRGRLIEEDHYYAYGLRIAGLSSKKLDVGIEGHLGNNYLYQGSFSEFDEDLGWNDFALRSYDPQTGRWLQMDPLDQFASPYIGMGDDPVSNTDPSGGGIGDVVTSINSAGEMSAVFTVARAAPQVAQTVVGLGARVFATVATQVTRYLYSNATSQLTTSTYHNESFIDNESNEQMNLAGTSTETYYQQVDVTGEHLQAQKSAMEKAMALDKLHGDFAKLHAFTELVWNGGAQKTYRNAVGETRTYGRPESLGNDLVGQAFGMYAMGGGLGGLGRGAAEEELGAKYAFGLKNEVPGFADEIGASHLMKDPNWKSSFENIISNPKNELHFTLNGIDETPMNMILTPGRSGINWEMNTLYNSPAFENTMFYYGQNTYKGYGVFQIKP